MSLHPRGSEAGTIFAATVRTAARLATHSRDPVLLQGETGTGKEWLARFMHDLARPGKPFVAVNMPCVPSELFEAEMMGTKAGACTGAVSREGCITRAPGGGCFSTRLAT
jgi:transcriptional regulator with PAS, ATPase and Fis domain